VSVPAHWLWVCGPWFGGPHHPLVRAKGRKITLQLNDASSCSFSINGLSPVAGELQELVTDVHALREATPGAPRDRVFRGRLGPTSDDLDGTTHTVGATAWDYREVLARRILWSSSPRVFAGADQGAIVAALVADAQSRPGGDLRMSVTGTATGQFRERTYDLGKSVGEEIQALSEVVNGFDWDVVAPTQEDLVLRIHYPAKGTATAVVLSWGDELVAKVTRTVPVGEFANAYRVSGRAPERQDGATVDPVEPPPVELAADDIGATQAGRWEKAEGTDLTSVSGLGERAAWLLDEGQSIRPTYSVTLRAGAWRGRSHIDTGDWVRLRIRSGRLAVDSVLRVHTIDIPVDDDGREGQVQLSLGGPRQDYGRRAALADRRLADLERR
jgi:hypothetical protein